MYLNDKEDRYTGILNGVDYTEWNPAIDKLIPQVYNPDDLTGKFVCKRSLQERFLLNLDQEVPIFGVVSRFADQKGLDLLVL